MLAKHGNSLEINADRLWQTLLASAKIGPGRGDGLRRLALSDADKEMRDLSEKFIEKTLADLEAKGLPGREVYAKMKAMSAEYSK